MTVLEASAVAAGGAEAPLYLAFADAQAQGDQVLGGKAGRSIGGAGADRGGSNRFTIA